MTSFESTGLAGSSGPPCPHFVMFMFENKAYSAVLAHPNWQPLIERGLLFTNFHANTHPSQPNYIMQIGGSAFNIVDDFDHSIDKAVPTLIDRFEEAGVTWKAYQENYIPLNGGNCNLETSIDDGKYRRKHNPFVSFESISNNPDRCARIVPADQMLFDLKTGNLSQFSYFTPNMQNDAHNTDLTFAGKWLHNWLLEHEMLLPVDTCILIAWDEDDYSEDNRIANFMLGNAFKPNSVSDLPLNQYSITKFIEDNFGLASLHQNDLDAVSFISTVNTSRFNDIAVSSHSIIATGSVMKPALLIALIVGGVVGSIVLAYVVYYYFCKRKVHAYRQQVDERYLPSTNFSIDDEDSLSP